MYFANAAASGEVKPGFEWKDVCDSIPGRAIMKYTLPLMKKLHRDVVVPEVSRRVMLMELLETG